VSRERPLIGIGELIAHRYRAVVGECGEKCGVSHIASHSVPKWDFPPEWENFPIGSVGDVGTDVGDLQRWGSGTLWVFTVPPKLGRIVVMISCKGLLLIVETSEYDENYFIWALAL